MGRQTSPEIQVPCMQIYTCNILFELCHNVGRKTPPEITHCTFEFIHS